MTRYEVLFTHGAERDLEEIHAWLSTSASPAQADELLDALLEVVTGLTSFPERGAFPGELLALGLRSHRQVLCNDHRIIYTVHESQVFVVLIAHGRRDMQSLLARRLLRGS